jgi:hypothetical protein
VWILGGGISSGALLRNRSSIPRKVDRPLWLEERLKRRMDLWPDDVWQRVIGQKFLRPRRLRASSLDVLAKFGDTGREVCTPVGANERESLPESAGEGREDGKVNLKPKLNLLRIKVHHTKLFRDERVVHAEEILAVPFLKKRHLSDDNKGERAGKRG